VGAFLLVAARHLHRITGVAEMEKVHSFHDATTVHVQTRDDSLGEHWSQLAPRPAAESPMGISVRPNDSNLRPPARAVNSGGARGRRSRHTPSPSLRLVHAEERHDP